MFSSFRFLCGRLKEISTESARCLLLIYSNPRTSGVDSSCASGVTEEVLGVQRRDVLCRREVVRAVFLEAVSHSRP